MSSVNITVDTSQWDKLAVRLADAPVAVARRFVRDGTPVVLENMKNRTPRREGILAESERADYIDEFHSIISTNSGYGAYVDLPTRAHVIEPRRRRFLRFRIDGRIVYAKRVFHPGTSGAFFRQAAIEDSMPTLIDLLRQTTEQELR